jgi:hypothetical protein
VSYPRFPIHRRDRERDREPGARCQRLRMHIIGQKWRAPCGAPRSQQPLSTRSRSTRCTSDGAQRVCSLRRNHLDAVRTSRPPPRHQSRPPSPSSQRRLLHHLSPPRPRSPLVPSQPRRHTHRRAPWAIRSCCRRCGVGTLPLHHIRARGVPRG